MTHEPNITDDNVPVVENQAHNEVINLDEFLERLEEATDRFSVDAYNQRPKEQALSQWLDDFQTWLDINELIKKESA